MRLALSLCHPRDKVLTLRLWFRFSALLVVTVGIGLALGYFLLRYSLAWCALGLVYRCGRLAHCAEVVTVNYSLCCVRALA